jgi:hypothetical protein
MKQPFLFCLLLSCIFFGSCVGLTACSSSPAATTSAVIADEVANVKIAFMPDIHFHDIYGDFANQSFVGLPTTTPTGTANATIRSMRSQLQSTRLFNENYFALLAALDDVVQRGIKYVALPGDFSDDGQPLHMQGLKSVLDRYHREHGLEFFAAPGNHDPTRPFSHPAGKADYLGAGGKEQPIYSLAHPACLDLAAAQAAGTVCADEVQELGYEPIMALLGEHGFYPKTSYRYFETPYSSYTTSSYDFATAQREAAFLKRQYEICLEGSGGAFKQAGYSHCQQVPDSSYLVEPVTGLWLLAIDANVYLPTGKTSTDKTAGDLTAESFYGSGDAGYNKLLTHKTHLLQWITDVVKRAKREHKTLIAFSHFPMQEFYKGASDQLADVFGDDTFQLVRRPTTHTSQTLAATGLKIHVGGHMHMNDTGFTRVGAEQFLLNIQAPSLAAYVPAYKVLTLQGSSLEVETVQVQEVPRFNELFGHYQTEWQHLQQTQPQQNWDRAILNAKTYREFSEWHLRELVRLRFLPQDWPSSLQGLLPTLSGKDLLTLSLLSKPVAVTDLNQLLAGDNKHPAFSAWQTASQQAEALANRHNTSVDAFAAWQGTELILDFYKLCNAGQLALNDISPTRLQHYRLLAEQFANTGQQELLALLAILTQFQHGEANDHFAIDMRSGEITDLRFGG